MLRVWFQPLEMAAQEHSNCRRVSLTFLGFGGRVQGFWAWMLLLWKGNSVSFCVKIFKENGYFYEQEEHVKLLGSRSALFVALFVVFMACSILKFSDATGDVISQRCYSKGELFSFA